MLSFNAYDSKIINNGKKYIGILDKSDFKSGVKNDGQGNNYAFIKILNNDNQTDLEIDNLKLFQQDYPESEIFNLSLDKFAEKLNEKLFIFCVEKSVKGYKAVDVKILDRLKEITLDTKFIGIPFIKDSQKFEESVRKREKIDFEFGNSVDEESTIILMDDITEEIKIYYGLSYKILDNQLIFNDEDNDLKEIEVYQASPEINNYVAFLYHEDKPSIAFIPEKMINIDGMDKLSSDNFTIDLSEPPKQDNKEIENNDSEKFEEESDQSEENFKELDFIKKFINISEKKYKLIFELSDLINFHNSIKSNLLTILAGLSGSGKSKITEVYADSLGILNNDQYKMIPVRPFWQDDTDLLGFVDNTSNNYQPGDVGLVETLIEANKNKDKIYLVVFDEMNIARVEHYFSQFISVLERSPEERYINLYNKQLEPRLYNSERYPAKILIPENVRFIGTMNLDESTFQISNRLLDRANIIEFNIQSFTDKNKKPSLHKYNNIKNISYTKYKSFYNNSESLSQRELEFFEKLHKKINHALPGVGLSWRTLNNIERYIKRSIRLNIFKRENALDLQVKGRVLPKIRGTEEMVKQLIDEIIKLFEEYSDLSNFEESKKTLKDKERELEINGFAR